MENLVPIENYWLEGKNWYWENATKFGITARELELLDILDERAYLTEYACLQLQKIDRELRTIWLRLVIKDAYRSKELYELIYHKRVAALGKEDTDKILNTKGDYPHSTWNTVDVTIVSTSDKKPLQFYLPIENRELQVASRATDYYEKGDSEEEKLVHHNRMILKDIMQKYWFEWIAHEYRHFNLTT